MSQERAMKKSSVLALLCAFSLALAGSVGASSPSDMASASSVRTAVTASVGHTAIQAAIIPVGGIVELSACPGDITLLGVTDPVPIWTFQAGDDCNSPQDPPLPGPEIRVTAGESFTIHLFNYLDVPTSVLIPGQVVSAVGDAQGDFTVEADALTGTASYTIADPVEGTYLYESGTNGSIQVPMGLYGALIVDPDPASSGQAYSDPSTAYDSEAVLVLSEIDPNLNANPAGFDLLEYHPTHWLINGESYPDTDPITPDPDDRLLIRYLNAGFDNLSMATLGAHQRVVAKEAFVLSNAFDVVAEIIPAGATADVMVDTTSFEGQIPLYSRNEYVTNGDAYPGGMLTFIAPVAGAPDISIVSPANGATLSGDIPITIEASDEAPGSVTSVTWSVDGGTMWDLATDNMDGTYSAIWETDASDDGTRTILARVTDNDENTVTTSVNVTVANAPVVDFTPAADAVVYGDSVLIGIDAVDAADPAGSLTVTWSVDAGTPATAPYNGMSGLYESLPWDTTALSDGLHTITVEATDSDTNTTTVAHQVLVSNIPSGAIVSPVDGDSVMGPVTLAIAASDAEDGTALTVEWAVDGGTASPATYNAGTGLFEALWSGSVGSHTITATVKDSRDNYAACAVEPGCLTINVTVLDTSNVHVGALTGYSQNGGGPNWTAFATVTIHAADESPVAGADVMIQAVTVSKQGGTVTQDLMCSTNTVGTCTVSKSVNANQLDQFENTVTFNVTDVMGPPTWTYDPAVNHDEPPEGSVVVER